MARPRIFVSSTYYDLKPIRVSLRDFIESLGYEAILSERGNIPYDPEKPLDESCYFAAGKADILVMIVGGRYGSVASSDTGKVEDDQTSSAEYDSVTKKELDAARDADVPCYILIDSEVRAEYETYKRNPDKEDITYAHVDSPNVFKLIQHILSQSHNNPTHAFSEFSDISSWLQEQWAGRFKNLLDHRSENKRLDSLAGQIRQLSSVSDTLKTYMEAVIRKEDPEEGEKLISTEAEKLEDAFVRDELKGNSLYQFMHRKGRTNYASLLKAFKEAETLAEFVKIAGSEYSNSDNLALAVTLQDFYNNARNDINLFRSTLGIPLMQKRLETVSKDLDSVFPHRSQQQQPSDS